MSSPSRWRKVTGRCTEGQGMRADRAGQGRTGPSQLLDVVGSWAARQVWGTRRRYGRRTRRPGGRA